MKIFIQIFGLMLCLIGCTESQDLDVPNPAVASHEPAMIPVDISHTGLPLVAMVPPNTDLHIDSKWNETFGRLELTDATGMDLFIQDSDRSCADKKRELDASIFQITTDFENDSLFCYTTSLPDGATTYSHIFGSFVIGESNYTFENNPLVECTPKQISHMKEVIENMVAAELHKP